MYPIPCGAASISLRQTERSLSLKEEIRVRVRITVVLVACLSLSVWVLGTGAYAQNGTADVLAGFHPYRGAKPQAEGISPGMTINQDNVGLAEKVLAPEIVRIVQAGDFSITVQDTIDFPALADYIQASVQHAGILRELKDRRFFRSKAQKERLAAQRAARRRRRQRR